MEELRKYAEGRGLSFISSFWSELEKDENFQQKFQQNSKNNQILFEELLNVRFFKIIFEIFARNIK